MRRPLFSLRKRQTQKNDGENRARPRADCHAKPERRRGVLALRIGVAAALVLVTGAMLMAQFTGYPQTGLLYKDGETFLPENMHEHAEWTFARFRYDVGGEFRYWRFQRWEADYPKADRQFVIGVKRLTRINARSTEHVVDADTNVLFDYPWIYVEDPGAWRLSDGEIKQLREYIYRGGFIMLDDSWGDQEWAVMAEGVQQILPGRPIEDIPPNDPIFHTVYDLVDLKQIPGTRYVWGRRWIRPDEAHPRWAVVRDEKGRIVIAICQNSDVGDAWEWADSPRYPQPQATEAYRLGINYIVYAMTH
jgi:Domain of unknown function (DUF4159)